MVDPSVGPQYMGITLIEPAHTHDNRDNNSFHRIGTFEIHILDIPFYWPLLAPVYPVIVTG